jgi:hypothetical protein
VKEKNCCHVKQSGSASKVCILANSEKDPLKQDKKKNEETLYEKYGFNAELIVCSGFFPQLMNYVFALLISLLLLN